MLSVMADVDGFEQETAIESEIFAFLVACEHPPPPLKKIGKKNLFPIFLRGGGGCSQATFLVVFLAAVLVSSRNAPNAPPPRSVA